MDIKADFSVKLRIENAAWGGLHDAVIDTVETTASSGYTYTRQEISIELPAGLKPKDFIGTIIHADIPIETRSFSYELRDLYATCTLASKPYGLSEDQDFPTGALQIVYGGTLLQGAYNPENGLLKLTLAG